MARETKDQKAERYLCEGRIIVVRVDRRAIVANVRGSGAVWRTWWHAGTWSCDCPHEARTTNCRTFTR
ncbi:MAG: hypothetical protein U5K30_01450 [Acidimicrobiales bacterium]|nr:hypothetical protein [Acidimicrobiales bacterium]